MSDSAIRNAVHCRDCGTLISPTAHTCPHCGGRQMATTNSLGAVTPSGRSRIAAALFAFFLGGFGVHKFYLGQVGLGVLYLIFFWTFIPAIIAFIEAILYLTMSDEEFERKYG